MHLRSDCKHTFGETVFILHRRRLILALPILFLLATSTSAYAQTPFAWWAYNARFGFYIEQESAFYAIPQSQWVYRSSALAGCHWELDDMQQITGNGGSLDPGGTSVYTACIIADDPKYGIWGFNYGITLSAPSPALVATISLPGFTHRLTAVKSGNNNWTYTGCASGPIYTSSSPDIVNLPNTNGGSGVPTRVTLSVSNPTKFTVHNISSSAFIADGDYQANGGEWDWFGGANYCRGPFIANGTTSPVFYADAQP